ncbi:hypothetical protein ACFL35_06985 [Candidatus Riflebacteria bacterium]
MSHRAFAFFCSVIFCFFLGFRYYKEELKKNKKFSIQKLILNALPLKITSRKVKPPKIVYKEKVVIREKIVEKPVYINKQDSVKKIPAKEVAAKPTENKKAKIPPVDVKKPPEASSTLALKQVKKVEDEKKKEKPPQKAPDKISRVVQKTASPTLALKKTKKSKKPKASDLDRHKKDIVRLKEKIKNPLLYWPITKENYNPFTPAEALIPRIPKEQVTEVPAIIEIPKEAKTEEDEEKKVEEVEIIQYKHEMANVYQGSITTKIGRKKIITVLLSGRGYQLFELFPSATANKPKKIVKILDEYVLMTDANDPNELYFAFHIKLSPAILQKFRANYLKS